MIGRTLKHYTVEEQIGKGGMGVVYRARDTRLGRPVALKVLSSQFTGNVERRRRFLQEARTASSISHPAIAQIYDVDEVDDTTFIAMEFVEGRTVRQLVAEKELDLLLALEIAIQVGEGLGKAHEAAIIHRDIKSDNIMVTREGHAKILDFGLAKPLALTSPGPSESSSQAGISQAETMVKTQAGTVVGTIAYMSPEQARGRTLDPRSDLFSLGVVLYEMVTGRLPFGGESLLDTMHAIAFEETRPVTALRENLPPDLQRIVARCLKKQPEDRYTDAAKLVSELKALKRDTESGITRAIPIRERIREGFESLRDMPKRQILAGAGLIVSALLILYFFAGDRGPSVGSLIFLGIVGLLAYRRMRNRSQRLLRSFVDKAAKMPELQVIVFRDNLATVVVNKAEARIYVHLNLLMEKINKKMFFGQPMQVGVREGLSPEEIKTLLEGPGVLYVRDERREIEPGKAR